mmetsp:Transcript_18831/g.26431  ORF Transcript_18831/g.26431 Transcript_18831/m.26431 type:complete len:154 (+) Transcript_18831:30-491(+)|eukprot:CAMPEP_0175090992 /NCGR_PEP_ID=MMETSP0086_2-20121207/1659_1 /TAXON_ID=136419 /ORGANISM="Unknown Unknown, Strain D1" /LENGTH=153 /DNA_ID=CAMNT_0016363693 /DNA_START=29 /DNA_END=490 /DNA_ORIENTATION=+
MAGIPRSFKLRDELEHAEKGDAKNNDPHSNFVSYGIQEDGVGENGFDKPQTYPTQLDRWQASIIGPQNTNLGDRIYMLNVYAPSRYPDEPPEIKFNMPKINIDCVDSQGKVNSQKLFPEGWKREYTMYQYLVRLRERMAQQHKNPQPSPDSSY